MEYMVMESFADHMQAFPPRSCIASLDQGRKPTYVSLADLFRIVMHTLDGEEALQEEEARHVRIPFINKDSEMEVRRL